MKNILFNSSLITKNAYTKRFFHLSTCSYNNFNPSMPNYLENAYKEWKKDRNSVDKSWDAYFLAVSNEVENCSSNAKVMRMDSGSYNLGANSLVNKNDFLVVNIDQELISKGHTNNIYDLARIVQFIKWYQKKGYLYANLNPLHIPNKPPYSVISKLLQKPKITYKDFGFNENDLDREFFLDLPSVTGFLKDRKKSNTLRELIKNLEETYCGSIGFEFMHVFNEDIVKYIINRIENHTKFEYDNNKKKRIMEYTAKAVLFEKFLAEKFATVKRFGADGIESLISGLMALVKYATMLNYDHILFGSSHRGRLNILTNVLHKPLEKILCEFRGKTCYSDDMWGNSGDVKYHLGIEVEYFDKEFNRNIHLSIVDNASHLESVDPILMGQARAEQYYLNDKEKNKILPIIIHGDASIAGQGIVYESFQMSQLPSYNIGGTIHIVANNQIGFTTYPIDSRSSMYCTGIAKCIDIPIIHVNADDPEAVTYVFELALDIRNKFKTSVIIDLIGYRRFGHNELDMPNFTNPCMYKFIEKHASIFELYSEKLIKHKVITKKELEGIKNQILDYFNAAYEKSKIYILPKSEKYLSKWEHMAKPYMLSPFKITGVEKHVLVNLGKKIFTFKEKFTPHAVIKKIYNNRLESLDTGKNIDYGTAELLAYATLLSEGFHIRLSGQDCQRGAFSHRHIVLHDQVIYESYNIFDSLKTPHIIEANNSHLSEYACLGYEVGYSYVHPDTLVVCEAQFGDFFNGAQVMIDNYIASGEAKWNKQSGIVILLPHGYDGQGPEHSSARVERFLQLCDDREDVVSYRDEEDNKSIQQHNWQIVNCTKPSNFFHCLRRQMHRSFRKPLIAITPKKMLKMRAAFDVIENFLAPNTFLPYLPEEHGHKLKEKEHIKRIILCSGQVYYDLIIYRDTNKIQDVAIARIEQLSPFPFISFMKDLQSYPNLRDVVWCQEEHMNMGPWFYVSPRIKTAIMQLKKDDPSWNIEKTKVNYAGRDVYAAQSAGDSNLHERQLNEFLEDSFDLKKEHHIYAHKYTGNL